MKKDGKTIKVVMYFSTNDLEVKVKGKPAISCWDYGWVVFPANKSKNIKAGKKELFRCFDGVPPALKRLFHKAGIIKASRNCSLYNGKKKVKK